MGLIQSQPNLNYSYGSALGSFENAIPKIEGFVIDVNLPSNQTVKVSINESLVLLQKNNIVIKNRSDVYRYLSLSPKLISILSPICETTRELFGLNTELSLELYSDPEIKDQYLTLYVRQSNYDNNLLGKINNISQQYEKELSDADGYLLITTDYRLPQLRNV